MHARRTFRRPFSLQTSPKEHPTSLSDFLAGHPHRPTLHRPRAHPPLALPPFSALSAAVATGGDPAARSPRNSPHHPGPAVLVEGPSGPPVPNAPAPAAPLVCSSLNNPPYFLADATGGDLSSHPLQFSPQLASALLDQEDSVCSIWPAFSDLRAAAHAAKQSRLRIVISAAVCEGRLIFAAAFFVRCPRHPSLRLATRYRYRAGSLFLDSKPSCTRL